MGFTLGVWKGFLRSLLGVLGLVAGAYFAVRYYGLVQPYLGRVSSLDPLISTVLSVVLIFISVQVVFLVVRRIMKALVDLTKLGWVDRTFGAALGLTASFCVVAAGVQAMLVGVPELPLLRESRLIEPVNRLAARGINVIPSEAKARLDEIASKFNQLYDSSPSSSPAKGSGSPKELFPGASSGSKRDRSTPRGGGSGGS